MIEANLTLILTSASLIGCGVYLLLERSLTRVLVGLLLMSNGISLAFLVAGGMGGAAPIVVEGQDTPMADPLPQAMVLTAIVIALATTSFVLAMAYRSWQLTGHDDVQDDVEDDVIRRLAASDVTSQAFVAARDDPDQVEESSDFAVDQLAADKDLADLVESEVGHEAEEIDP